MTFFFVKIDTIQVNQAYFRNCFLDISYFFGKPFTQDSIQLLSQILFFSFAHIAGSKPQRRISSCQVIVFRMCATCTGHFGSKLMKNRCVCSSRLLGRNGDEGRIQIDYQYKRIGVLACNEQYGGSSFNWIAQHSYSLLNRPRKNALQQYQNTHQRRKPLKRMFYYTPSTTFEPNNNVVYYFMSNGFGFTMPTCDYYPVPQTPYLPHHCINLTTESNQNISTLETKPPLISLKTEISETIEGSSESRTMEKLPVQATRPTYKKCEKLGIQEIKLDFRIEWKNQNRNIIPNLVNQMLSFLLKKNKSQKLITKLFSFHPHAASWTPNKFYLYMKKIKDSITHYVNESVIQYFFQVHEPKCEIYEEEEQQFYMKLCRIAIVTFLRNDAVIISLTSTRMSEAKRKTHLIAREALLKKFLELARNRLP